MCIIQYKKKKGIKRAELEIDHILCFLFIFLKRCSIFRNVLACRSSMLAAITVFGLMGILSLISLTEDKKQN